MAHLAIQEAQPLRRGEARFITRRKVAADIVFGQPSFGECASGTFGVEMRERLVGRFARGMLIRTDLGLFIATRRVAVLCLLLAILSI